MICLNLTIFHPNLFLKSNYFQCLTFTVYCENNVNFCREIVLWKYFCEILLSKSLCAKANLCKNNPTLSNFSRPRKNPYKGNEKKENRRQAENRKRGNLEDHAKPLVFMVRLGSGLVVVVIVIETLFWVSKKNISVRPSRNIIFLKIGWITFENGAFEYRCIHFVVAAEPHLDSRRRIPAPADVVGFSGVQARFLRPELGLFRGELKVGAPRDRFQHWKPERYIHKANFLAGRDRCAPPAHGSPSAVTAVTHRQNEPNSGDLGSTPTSRILRVIASYSARIPAQWCSWRW